MKTYSEKEVEALMNEIGFLHNENENLIIENEHLKKQSLLFGVGKPLKEKKTPNFDYWLMSNFEERSRNKFIQYSDGEFYTKAKAFSKYRKEFKI